MPDITTIAAIATPAGQGGIGIVRLSGPQAFLVAQQVFRSHSGKELSGQPGYTGLYGKVWDGDALLDEAVAFLYRAPKSYTGEDIVELCCHGGSYLTQAVLRACLHAGAVLAGPGEFTQRAFLNGKMDLTQAEAVMDLISAGSAQSARSALSLREGALSKKAEQITSDLITLSSHLAAWVDYPEEEIPEVTGQEIDGVLKKASAQLEELLSTYDTGHILKHGVETAIVGRPNVGKSTLMNALTGYERSIVTEIPGTTRDMVSDTVRLGEVTLNLWDTAGIRETDDPVEQLGVRLAKEKLSSCQLVLLVLDGSEKIMEEDLNLLVQMGEIPVITIVNKTDLGLPQNFDELKPRLGRTVFLSAKTGEGVRQLEEEITSLLHLKQVSGDSAVIMNERQRDCISRAAGFAKEALLAYEGGFTFDAVNVCVDDTIQQLLELTGQRVTDQVVHQVFSQFCVGK